MFKQKKILAIIPARGGSKGIPGKNIKLLAGKPLIAYTIESAKQSLYLDRVIVSTDSKKIASLAKRLGAYAPFLRPKRYSKDTSPSSDAIVHAIEWLEKNGESYDLVILLEPTSPLRREGDIDGAIRQFIESYDTADALVSVGEIHLENPYIAKIIGDGYVRPLLGKSTFHQRQQLPKTYFPYGVIYMSKISTYKKTKTFYQKRTLPYFIERWQNYEIDDMTDFLCVEQVLKLKVKSQPKTIIINGNQILLKSFTAENLQDPRYYKWLLDKKVMRTIGRSEYLKPIEFSAVELYVKALQESDHDYFFALYTKNNKKFIGTVKIGSIDWYNKTADVGIMIGDKSYWGKGLATDALRSVCKYAFAYLHLLKLTGGCMAPNVAMVKCFEKIGFKKEGVQRKQNMLDGTYVDHFTYGLFPNELSGGLI